MSDSELKNFLAKVRGNGPASPSAIDSLQANLSLPLPDDYRRFLLLHDGGEASGPSGSVTFWSVSHLSQFNSEYEVETYMPGFSLLAYEDDSGDAFGFDLRPGAAGSILRVPVFGMGWSEATPVAASFQSFLASLSA